MSWASALFLWKQLEGGRVLNPNDPGGETDDGIRKDLYLAANPGAVWPASEVAKANYLRATYWDSFHCGELKAPADSVFFQFVGNSPAGAVEALQCIVGVIPDGDMGPVTLAALRGFWTKDIGDSLLLAQRVRYAALHGKGDYYFVGLQNRVDQVAQAMAKGVI